MLQEQKETADRHGAAIKFAPLRPDVRETKLRQ